MCNIPLLAVVFATSAVILAQDYTDTIDIQTLSELPIERLLSVRNQFDQPDENVPEEDVEEPLEAREDGIDNVTNIGGGVALPLRRTKTKEVKRGDWEEEKGGKKGVQSIFQMSITTLAFLAFGGYLLCLLVQGLKGKGGKRVHVVITSSTAAPVTMAMFRRRRRRRRPIRIRRPQHRPKRDVYEDGDQRPPGVDGSSPTVDMTPHIDTEKMLDALVSLSEAYARYHTIDYKRVNQTIIHF